MNDVRNPLDAERLERAASVLRPKEREALRLNAAEGLRSDEIAARLGITPEAAQRLLAKAIWKFDKAIERQERSWWRLW